MPDWNRGQMADELRNRGFHFLDADGPTRVNDMIQAAIEEINGEEPWPYNFIETQVNLPVVIPDLGEIEHLSFDGGPLSPTEYGDVMDRRNSQAAGTPRAYYFAGQILRTTPTATGLFDIAYYSRYYWIDYADPDSRALTALNNASLPTIPSDFRDVVVLLAVTYAAADSQGPEQEQAARSKYEQRLEQMRRQLIRPITDEAKKIRRVSGEDYA